MKLHPFLSNCPNALVMDIGTGTKDVMFFENNQALENNIKMVVPAPASIMGAQIESYTGDLRISGYTMGGGYLAKVLKKHHQKGFKVTMESLPAFTIRNNIKEIELNGVELVGKVPTPPGPTHFFDEIELEFYFSQLKHFGGDPSLFKVIGVSVQDHGYHTDEESSRHNRFRYFLEHLNHNPVPQSLVFTDKDLPPVFERLSSAVKCVADYNSHMRVLLIDTSFSAILGCFLDPRVSNINGPVLYINFGNGHTMACTLREGKIQAFFEHHTRIIKEKPEVMKDFMTRLVEGNLSSQEVFEDDGNGCVTFEKQKFNELSRVVVTGPQRHLMAHTNISPFIEAAPGGDMMMTGPIGLLRGMAFRLEAMQN